MNVKTLLPFGLASILLIVIAIEASLWNGLIALGYDPVFGFLFSPIPLLRAAAILQAIGAICGVLGALIVLRRER